jgi:hypothetical protein
MIASQGEAPPPSNHPVEGESLEKSLRSGVFGHDRYIGGVFWGLANDTNPVCFLLSHTRPFKLRY